MFSKLISALSFVRSFFFEPALGPFNPAHHVKIWFTSNPNECMNTEIKLRLLKFCGSDGENGRCTPSPIQASVIYSSKLLNTAGLQDLETFQGQHPRITFIDFDTQIAEESQQFSGDRALFALASAELQHFQAHTGGNLAAASDICRLLFCVLKKGTYSDFDAMTTIGRKMPRSDDVSADKRHWKSYGDLSPIALPRKTSLLFNSNATFSIYCNDVLALAHTYTSDHQPPNDLIIMQNGLIEAYKNPLAYLKKYNLMTIVFPLDRAQSIFFTARRTPPSIWELRFLAEGVRSHSYCEIKMRGNFQQFQSLSKSIMVKIQKDFATPGFATNFSEAFTPAEIMEIKKAYINNLYVQSEWLWTGLSKIITFITYWGLASERITSLLKDWQQLAIASQLERNAILEDIETHKPETDILAKLYALHILTALQAMLISAIKNQLNAKDTAELHEKIDHIITTQLGAAQPPIVLASLKGLKNIFFNFTQTYQRTLNTNLFNKQIIVFSGPNILLQNRQHFINRVLNPLLDRIPTILSTLFNGPSRIAYVFKILYMPIIFTIMWIHSVLAILQELLNQRSSTPFIKKCSFQMNGSLAASFKSPQTEVTLTSIAKKLTDDTDNGLCDISWSPEGAGYQKQRCLHYSKAAQKINKVAARYLYNKKQRAASPAP